MTLSQQFSSKLFYRIDIVCYNRVMKGRNTTKIGIRLEDWVVEALQKRAGNQSVGAYIKEQILKSINHTGSTTKSKLWEARYGKEKK